MSIEAIPAEIWLHIFRHLQPKELGLGSQVCKQWYVLTNDVHLWRPIAIKLAIERGWGLPPENKHPKQKIAKYIHRQKTIGPLMANLRFG
jgi:hypothetical protein